MAKKVGRDLGLRPRLPKKTIPHTGLKSNGGLDFNFVISEIEKEENDYDKIKRLVYYYEWISRQQINLNVDRIRKNFNLAEGVIDPEDYIPGASEQTPELNVLDDQVSLDHDLKFYPIVPTIVNSLVSELGKHHVNVEARAINSEATNEILEERNNLLRQLIIKPLEQMFNQSMSDQGVEEGTDIYEEQKRIFESLPKIQKYMNSEFRLTIEKWANNQIEIDRKRFRLKDLEKKSFYNKLATDRPLIHVNLLDDDYNVEVIDPRYASWLKSPYLDDVSNSVMFHWFEYESPLNIIARFGKKLREEDVEKLNKLHLHYRSMMTMETGGKYQIDTPGLMESAQNHLAFKEMFNAPNNDSKYRGDEYKERLLIISNMYFQVPRKFGRVTIKTGDDVFSAIVDETYKPTYEPIYDTTVVDEKNEDTLVFGEHIEWFYKNELWRSVKINLSSNPNPDYSDDIFITLDKFPVEFSTTDNLFGTSIPVFGGPLTNRYNSVNSIVNKCKPWQVLYNYVMNRADQLLKTEIGKFLAINQNVIPKESMGEDWGPNNLLQFLQVARDLKIVGTDNSILNTGANTTGLTGGYGQVIDLSVTQDVLEKLKLAEVFKNECLMQVGISPQFIGDMSPEETATGVAQGINRSTSNVKYLYEEHFATWEKAKTAMLEFAKYLNSTQDTIEQNFINSEGEREIFRMPGMELPLAKFGVFITSDVDDSIVLEQIRQWAIRDNTVDATLLDKISIMSAKSISKIYSTIKDLQKEKEIQDEGVRRQEMQMQQETLESQERQLKEKLAFDAQENEKDRLSQEYIAKIRVIGQSQFSEGNGVDEILKLEEQQLKQRNYYADLINKAAERSLQTQQMINDNSQKTTELSNKDSLERERLQIEREKIQAKLQESKNNLKIAKINK